MKIHSHPAFLYSGFIVSLLAAMALIYFYDGVFDVRKFAAYFAELIRQAAYPLAVFLLLVASLSFLLKGFKSSRKNKDIRYL